MPDVITGFTLELDGDSDALERIANAAFEALSRELTLEVVAFGAGIGGLERREHVVTHLPVHGKITYRRKDTTP